MGAEARFLEGVLRKRLITNDLDSRLFFLVSVQNLLLSRHAFCIVNECEGLIRQTKPGKFLFEKEMSDGFFWGIAEVARLHHSKKKYYLCRMNELTIEDWGLVPYVDAWERQRRCFDETLEAVARNVVRPARIVLCEHPHVYTLGRSGKEANMLLDEEQLERIGATYYHIDRGGDITYHGPGQLVCYPILYLEDFHLGLKAYVHVLEEAVIRVCASYGVAAGRVDGATGVWLEGDTPRARKVCAIGVRSSHFVTMHGLARTGARGADGGGEGTALRGAARPAGAMTSFFTRTLLQTKKSYYLCGSKTDNNKKHRI